MKDPERFLNVRDTARLLGVHENTIRNWADSGELAVAARVGRGRFRRFDPQEILRIAEEMEQRVDDDQQEDRESRETE